MNKKYFFLHIYFSYDKWMTLKRREKKKKTLAAKATLLKGNKRGGRVQKMCKAKLKGLSMERKSDAF